MKKWHFGGFFGCLLGGIVALGATCYVVALLMNLLGAPLTSDGMILLGGTVFLLIAVAGLLVGLCCQGSCIDELNRKIRILEEKLQDKSEE